MPSTSFFDSVALLPWIEAATIFFGFAWGAMIGSFINVVVHRVPLGASVVTTPSRCPTCGMSIRPWHNVPVFGWLLLRGKCRDCQEPIAATYPIVEAGCGAITMLVATSELVFGGRWLACSPVAYPVGIDRLMSGDWPLLAVCALHCFVVLSIVTWSLLDHVPWRLSTSRLVVPVVLAVLAVTSLPDARPPAIWRGLHIDQPFVDALARSLAGVATGWVLGSTSRGQGVRFGLPLLGSVLGWQGVALVAIVGRVTASVGWRWSKSPALPGLLVAGAGTLSLAFAGSVLAWLVGS